MLRHIVFGLAMIAAVASNAAQTPLRVAAAADLEPVLPHIVAGFEKSSGIQVEATYQASAALTMQIQNGAPFDLFLSADMGYPKRLISDGLADAAGSADSSTPINYANGTLVLWARKDSSLPAPSLDLLRSHALRRLAVADPDRAPYGRAAVAALTQPQTLRCSPPAAGDGGEYCPDRSVRRFRQRRCRPYFADLSVDPTSFIKRKLLRDSSRPLSADPARRGHRQQDNEAARSSQVPRLSALRAGSG